MSDGTTILNLNYIGTNPQIRNGRPHIIGTTIEVSTLVIQHIVHRQSEDDIATDYGLTLSQVYEAFAYYYAHKAEMDAMMDERRRYAESLKERQVGSKHKALS
jgi:uncharacterized protein (DUF433 family)